MSSSRSPVSPIAELLDAQPAVNVPESEYRRLLGYPAHHVPGERAGELAAWARGWYAEHGRPWVYLREARLQLTHDRLHLDGIGFRSKQLHEHLRRHRAERVVLVVASAGRECEEHARQLWLEAKPDEYYFLENFGSAVVEQLVAATSGRICDLGESDGLMAVPHYSPGYTGWDVSDQNKLFGLINRGMSRMFPGPIEVMSSGMLRPKKSILAVYGLAERRDAGAAAVTPCANCSFSPCQYRRVPYRHDPAPGEQAVAEVTNVAAGLRTGASLPASPKYSIGVRALRKWAQERVWLEPQADGTIEARFRFDGTTCTNQGRPLAFDYTVGLGSPAEQYPILRADCRPAPGDEGYTAMCAYLSGRETLMRSIADEKPLLGRPLDEVLSWTRAAAPSGCFCNADSRAHKWGLALEAIHFALTQVGMRTATLSNSNQP